MGEAGNAQASNSYLPPKFLDCARGFQCHSHQKGNVLFQFPGSKKWEKTLGTCQRASRRSLTDQEPLHCCPHGTSKEHPRENSELPLKFLDCARGYQSHSHNNVLFQFPGSKKWWNIRKKSPIPLEWFPCNSARTLTNAYSIIPL